MAYGDRKRLRIGGATALAVGACLTLTATRPADAFSSNSRRTTTGSTGSSSTRQTTRTTTLSASSSTSEEYYKHSAGWSSTINEQQGGFHHPKSELSAATLTEIPTTGGTYDFPDFEGVKDMFQKSVSSRLAGDGGTTTTDDVKNLLSAALLVTGNTVGASILCLPSFVEAPGMQISSALLLGIFGINLISGLLIAEVAIKQHEESDSDGDGDVPSSFKDFADATLDNPLAGNAIGIISIFTNMCVLSYSLMQAGDVAQGFGLDGTAAAVGVAAVLTALVGSQTNTGLSRVASASCAVLFASFAGILLPGLANVADPVGTLLAPGTATTTSITDASVTAIPIFLSAMVYQNIVPTITKLLNYDRSKSALAIGLGSLIPTLMYVSFSFAVLGGGIDMSSMASGGPCLTAFSVAALAGSSIACVMSISEEFDSMLSHFVGSSSEATTSPEVTSPKESNSIIHDEHQPSTETFSLPAVLLAVLPALAAGLVFSGGESFSDALKISGGYSVPALYGVLPVVLAVAQNNKSSKTQEAEADEQDDSIIREQATTTPWGQQENSLVPGGFASLSLLGAASAGFVGQEVVVDMSSAFSSAVGAVA